MWALESLLTLIGIESCNTFVLGHLKRSRASGGFVYVVYTDKYWRRFGEVLVLTVTWVSDCITCRSSAYTPKQIRIVSSIYIRSFLAKNRIQNSTGLQNYRILGTPDESPYRYISLVTAVSRRYPDGRSKNFIIKIVSFSAPLDAPFGPKRFESTFWINGVAQHPRKTAIFQLQILKTLFETISSMIC